MTPPSPVMLIAQKFSPLAHLVRHLLWHFLSVFFDVACERFLFIVISDDQIWL